MRCGRRIHDDHDIPSGRGHQASGTSKQDHEQNPQDLVGRRGLVQQIKLHNKGNVFAMKMKVLLPRGRSQDETKDNPRVLGELGFIGQED